MSNVVTIVVGYVQGDDVYELDFVPSKPDSVMTWSVSNETAVTVYEDYEAIGHFRDVKYIYRRTQNDD